MADDVPPQESPPDVDPKGGLWGGTFSSGGLSDEIRAILSGYRWVTTSGGSTTPTTITYFFPTTATDYLSDTDYYDKAAVANFAPVTPAQQAAVLSAFALITSYTGLQFQLAASGSGADAALRFSRDTKKGGSAAYYPYPDTNSAGDNYLGGNGFAVGNYVGTDAFNTIMHELGHAMGLKHGHEAENGNPALPSQLDDNEFSVMTYRSYLDADLSGGGATEAVNGSSPQSYMMYDIAALQAMYGANWDGLGKTATYAWDPTTGLETLTVNGTLVAPAVTMANKTGNIIFETVWTQGATATYDLSNFTDNQVDDMNPGQWMMFSAAQLAALNSFGGTPEYAPSPVFYALQGMFSSVQIADSRPLVPQSYAQGNVYNSLLYQGNTSSEISGLTAGSGNDAITGNDLDNVIHGGNGDDTISGGSGTNTLYGEAGNDTLTADSTGINDTLTGGLGDDTYIIKSASAAIVEQPGEGTDTAQIHVNGYTVAANVEIANLETGVSSVTGNDTGMTINASNDTGTTITGGNASDTLNGGDQADTLSGGSGNDTLRGGKGDDVLTGGPGDDTFAFARGDGNDTVHASSIDGSDIVAFDPGVAHAQLWFAQSNNDLVVSVIGEDQAITVAGWFASTDNRFGQVSAGDGFTATASAVDQLVQAMSAFSPPPLGETTLPPDLASSLAPALATNWQHS
jgi:serralysin